ncbi:glycosyltransferase family 39 protein [Streptomyces sp. NBC_00536]|uniref:ArnT family glycosyltransferase n=1 Tax=Streptomyces sp. NBC_00536 TaxID=2975769 RepID=UPI002E813FED|nr:glycosyltransferase family 39 protein [Streptomyces sp. NBC_00536]WUC83135.1 glycosyltransferase family 39 protein [Streptomyces sp. NBC_00536]
MNVRGDGRLGPQQLPLRPVELRPFALRPVAWVAAVLAAALVALSGRYGFHRDELYFLLAGRHPAWGYVDQPPLTPLLARAGTAVFGTSPTGLRVIPALLSACSVVLTALLARELGAGRGGQILAAACCACSGYVLAIGHLLSTSTFDLTAELGVLLLTLRLLRTRNLRWWPALGMAVGVTLLNKQLVLSLLLALLLALPLGWLVDRLVVRLADRPVARPRREFAWRPRPGSTKLGNAKLGSTKLLLGPLLALFLALLICAPTLWWQATHGWPELKVARVLSHIQGVSGRLLFLPLQLLQFSPVLVPVAVFGLRRLLRDDELRWARPMALAYPVLCVLVLVGGGKPYYPLPLLLAVTAPGCEPVIRRAGRARHAGRPWRTLAPLLLLAAATSALAALPVLPVSAVAVTNAVDIDQGEQVGWPRFTRATAAAWTAIPAAQRAHAVLLTSNYGEAGALARYGPAYRLPLVYSGHMSLYDWGPPADNYDGPVLLVEQAGGQHRLERPFTHCRTVGRIDNGHGIGNQEQNAELVLCDGAHQRWSVLWPSVREY